MTKEISWLTVPEKPRRKLVSVKDGSRIQSLVLFFPLCISAQFAFSWHHLEASCLRKVAKMTPQLHLVLALVFSKRMGSCFFQYPSQVLQIGMLEPLIWSSVPPWKEKNTEFPLVCLNHKPTPKVYSPTTKGRRRGLGGRYEGKM